MIVAIVFFFLGVFILSSFLLTQSSIKNLDFDLSSYFPFDRIPRSKKWSALYYLTVIVGLLLLTFLLSTKYTLGLPPGA